MSGVQVLADGNPRQGGMDEDERDQCIHGLFVPPVHECHRALHLRSHYVLWCVLFAFIDVVNWFQRKAKLKNSTETSSDLQELEQALGTELPEALRSLLKKQSGGLWFDEYKVQHQRIRHVSLVFRKFVALIFANLFSFTQSLNAAAIVRTAETLAGIKGWKSSYIPFAADVDGAALITDVGSRNAVFEFGDDGKGSQLAPTLLQYLEEYRNRLLSGQYDYVEDVGLVERSRK